MPPRKRFGRNQLIAIGIMATVFFAVLGFGITVVVLGRGDESFRIFAGFATVFGPAAILAVLAPAAAVKRAQGQVTGGQP